MKIPFVKFGHQRIEKEMCETFERVLSSEWFLLGPELSSFEESFSQWLKVKHTVGVGSGTDAIYLALKALDIGLGDEVIIPALTAYPTATAVEMTGAKAVTADVCAKSGLIDPESVERMLSKKTKAVIAVHLYGQRANLEALEVLLLGTGAELIEDCAQSGARYDEPSSKIGSVGKLSCFSFYPTKNLGSLGDAGAVVCNDDTLAEKLIMLRNYGQSTRYHHSMQGINSRMSELQAAFLSLKLNYIDDWNAKRREIGQLYLERLPSSIVLNREIERDCFHLFPLIIEKREDFMEYLQDRGIATLIHYPVPIHEQGAYTGGGDKCPHTDYLCKHLVSIPLYPELTRDEALEIVDVINQFLCTV